MKKAATILLWISFGIGLLYVIITVIAAAIGGAMTPVHTVNSSVYAIGILYQLARTALPLIGRLIFMIIILFMMKSKSENIVAEIIAIILFADGGALLNTAISVVMNIMIANMGSAELASYGSMTAGANLAGFLGSISATLFIVGVSFAIAFKKVELADLRRIMEEEDE